MGNNTSFKLHMTCSHQRSPFRSIQPPRGEKGYYLIPSSGLQFPCFGYLLSLDLVLVVDTPNPEQEFSKLLKEIIDRNPMPELSQAEITFYASICDAHCKSCIKTSLLRGGY